MKLFRFILFPFSIIYNLLTATRNLFFDLNIFKQIEFQMPIIVVGNLSVGGTGKTPKIEYLIRLLKDSFKIALLSRGYNRKLKGFVHLKNFHTAEEVGDEPVQYFKKFKGLDVALCENRVVGIRTLINNFAPEVILLDDGFQHRKLKASFYILLTKYDDLFVDDFLLPTGNLRENRNAANRADVIVVTKCPINLSKKSKKAVEEKLKRFYKKVYFTTILYDKKTLGNDNISLDELKNYRVLLITGIAFSAPLLNFLKEKGISFKHLKFSDHHNFSSHEIEKIKYKFAEIKSSKKIILTTEKDYVRLGNKIKNISYLGISTSFLYDAEIEFNTLVLNHINNFVE